MKIEASFLSPRHHSVTGLKQSAENGCNLCMALWDIVCDRACGLERPNGETLDPLPGIIIIRPYNDGEEMFILEISYFVDGKVKKEAHVFTVGMLMIAYRGRLPSYLPRLHAKIHKGSPPLDDYHPPPSTDRDRPPSMTTLQRIINWLLSCSARRKKCPKAHKGRLPSYLPRLHATISYSIAVTRRLPPSAFDRP